MSVSPVPGGDRDRAIGTIVSAFADDPVERWMFPDPDEYLEHFPGFVAAFAGAAFEQRTAWQLGEFAAVALWLPPDAEADAAAIARVFTETVRRDKHADLFEVREQMERAHPAYPHWYLPWLAVDPARQGAGLGGELLRHCLETVDADGLPAYLETPNPRTLPFYERHGFEVTGQAQAGSCPPVTFMLRPSR
jgi:GNAT superfamily N-acetyltransferase